MGRETGRRLLSVTTYHLVKWGVGCSVVSGSQTLASV